MSKVAIITARGGSKRIPGKNIRAFLGKPIISYSIQAALDSGLFDEVMVSTDDEEIARVAKELGAVVPFLRSSHNADDFATTAEVLEEVLETYSNIGRNFEYACCIYPCAPLVTGELLRRAFSTLVAAPFSCVIPILSFSYPIGRALQMNKDETLAMIWPENLNIRSQDLPTTYHDAGQFYFFEVENFRQTKNYMIGRVGGVLLDDLEAQDIDNMNDWRMAELKYEMRHS